jgi:hypothetical protein
VHTLHLKHKRSTRLLHLDDALVLSGLRVITVDIEEPDAKDLRNMRSWILDQRLSEGPVIDVEFLVR